MEEFFEPIALGDDALRIVTDVRRILSSYRTQGYRLTLRQTYYQMVAHDLFPDSRKWRNVGGDKWVRDPNGTKNATPNYKWLGGIMTDARLCGMVDWDMIEDRGRECVENGHWDSPASIVRACSEQFRFDTWADQPWYVEVMVEKEAMEGIIGPVCRQLDIPFTANKGYSSCSAMREAGQRIMNALDNGRDICIIYLGDHDPSGVDMSRDVEDRLKLFSRYVQWVDITDEGDGMERLRKGDFRLMESDDYAGLEFRINRVALNMSQVRQYNPPPNPAKITDSRARTYIRNFGNNSWELDALEPAVLTGLVRDAVEEVRNDDLYAQALERQATARARIAEVADSLQGGTQ